MVGSYWFIFAGSSQFVIVDMLSNNLSLTTIIGSAILVNMRYVQYINLKEMMVVLENEIQLPLSYKYKNSVKEAYQEYKIR